MTRMTRVTPTLCGNQRDLARAKNQKKQQEIQKKKTASEKTGMSLSERKHRDAELMREKQRKKEEQEGQGARKQAVH
ncbi:PREDICTED: putative SERF-like protein [Papilio xuthus]|uniref:SERF-like protein n=1 Tax=Papilio xuthus TaxID=66420 RepID=A0AAJ6ZPN7_PAPXU|nr:PREDICTED: putative SERF-like protein [Papilio xuthus]